MIARGRAGPTPREIARANEHDVQILWEDGHRSVYPARELRLACPCAQCVDELTGEKLLAPGAVPHDVKPLSVSLVGRYAVNVQWSDGHGSGIYPFERLRHLCPCESCRGAAAAATGEPA